MEIKWISPKTEIPPFGEQFLVVLGGSGSTNAMETWQSYVKVCNVVISKQSPNDNEPFDEWKEFVEGGKKDYDQFQFYIFDYSDYTYGMGEDSESDWYTDAIVCWAFMPKIAEFKGV